MLLDYNAFSFQLELILQLYNYKLHAPYSKPVLAPCLKISITNFSSAFTKNIRR